MVLEKNNFWKPQTEFLQHKMLHMDVSWENKFGFQEKVPTSTVTNSTIFQIKTIRKTTSSYKIYQIQKLP